MKLAVKDAVVELANPADPFGDVRSAKLLLSGLLLPVEIRCEQTGSDSETGEDIQQITNVVYGLPWTDWVESDTPLQFKGTLDGFLQRFSDETLSERLSTGSHVCLVEVVRNMEKGSSLGLILRRSGLQDEEGRESFERIGTYEVTIVRSPAHSMSDPEDSWSDVISIPAFDDDTMTSASDASSISHKNDLLFQALESPFDCCPKQQFWLG